MSQLLCEQVVGRGLRRSSYAVGDDGKLGEEVAKIFGVPFEVVPLKENPAGNESRPPPKVWPIHALPERAELEIRFPRVERYMQRIRHRLKVDWDNIAPLCLDPMDIPPEVEMKAGLPSNTGRPALVGPGRIKRVDLNPYREGRRLQKLVFEPLAVRGVLPVLGGSPAVWNTAMVFFQLALPLGSHPSCHTPIVAGSRPHHLDRHLDRQMSALAPTTYPTTTLSPTIPILPHQR